MVKLAFRKNRETLAIAFISHPNECKCHFNGCFNGHDFYKLMLESSRCGRTSFTSWLNENRYIQAQPDFSG